MLEENTSLQWSSNGSGAFTPCFSTWAPSTMNLSSKEPSSMRPVSSTDVDYFSISFKKPPQTVRAALMRHRWSASLLRLPPSKNRTPGIFTLSTPANPLHINISLRKIHLSLGAIGEASQHCLGFAVLETRLFGMSLHRSLGMVRTRRSMIHWLQFPKHQFIMDKSTYAEHRVWRQSG
ncbi:hypothetical protein Dda_8222 [Drechslerella dactyloides]|uniref:Uncharacterized protein n=1 Tax=Drechslerella dactyloides TaxID=74499 RepID=A0AAD6NI12_DREDA|nr:hypothetical protein Dda_8222 [Drechslerella dactyloides]